MIELLEMLFLAIAQGIGEFLPISSSGHNAVIVHLFERFGEPLADDSSEFVKLNILLHVGSLVAVLIIFRQRIFDMFSKDLRLIPLLIIATIPAVVVGYPIHKFFPRLEDFLPLISICFIVTGCLLLYSRWLETTGSAMKVGSNEIRERNVAERPDLAGTPGSTFSYYRKGYLAFADSAKGHLDSIYNHVAVPQSPPEGKTTSTMTWKDALFIGCAQGFAVMPGLSRSGTTIVAGLFCKLKREEAAAFSFIMSIPIIAGGGLLEFVHMIRHPAEPGTATIPDWLLLVGALASCVAGIISLVFLLNWLKKGKLWYFAIWVFVMSPLTMLLWLTAPAEPDLPQEPAAAVQIEEHDVQ